eukprot:752590-Pyramimonas_sp.AAC.1
MEMARTHKLILKYGGHTGMTSPARFTGAGRAIRGMGEDRNSGAISRRGHGGAQRNGSKKRANAPATGGVTAEPPPVDLELKAQ